MDMMKELATLNDITAYDDVVSDQVTHQSSSTSAKRRRLVQKRVVKVPIKEMDDAHFNRKGEYCTNPPSDSWAWRKYGQKPIKGSPFPRGYYRCSSSKGCPARKQVERSQSDPTMLLINYSYDHNHSLPVNSRNHGKNPIVAVSVPIVQEPQLSVPAAVGDLESMISSDDFAWALAEFDTIPDSAVRDDSVFSRSNSSLSAEFAGYFSTMEEDDSLFADLGELPECSVAFGRTTELEERRREYNFTAAAPWFRNSTG